LELQIIKPITNSWKQWINTNLGRGCSDASMIEHMVAAGIDPEAARQWLGDVKMPATTAYRYETPRAPVNGHVINTNDREVRVAMRLNQPVVAIFDNVLSPQECDELVQLSSVKLKRSTVVDANTGELRAIDARSSQGTYFLVNENPFIAKLDRRIAELLHWPVENGEGLQILRYGIGGEYKPHFDYFSPTDPGSQAHLAKGGQRVSTLIIYLNDVQAEGETTFPAIGLRVAPRKGSAVYFEYCNSLGQVDDKTLHAGTPVAAGEKWIATKWMRERRYG
jgi:prolyl 4-hydroxylase